MRKQFCLLAMMLTMSALAFSQNTLTVGDFTLPQSGGSMTVQIHLDEEGVYAAYQFDIETPDGIVYPVDADGDVECTLGSGYDSSHSATVHWNAETGLLGVGVISMKSALFKATSLVLEIPLDKTTATVGTQLHFTVKDIIIIKQSGEKDALDDVTFTATIGEPTDTRVVLDETSDTVPETATGVDVRVKRAINAGEWSTICLPFAMTEAQVKEVFGSDVLLGDFTGVDSEFDDADNVVGIKVYFTNATAIEANHPYIIKVSAPVTEFALDGVDIVADEDEAYIEFDNGKSGSRRVVYSGFYGTFHAGTVLDEFTLFLSDNKFWYSAGKTKMKAFRAYFAFLDVLTEAENGTVGSRISMAFGNEATGISEIGNGTRYALGSSKKSSNSKYYDLQGRRVNVGAGSVPARKGLYIKDGKKEIVK